MYKLCDVEIGNLVRVNDLFLQGLMRERMLALGFTKEALIEVIRKGPKENLTLYKIRDTMIALRKEESSLISVKGI
ncbi:FeoA family protein [Clostridium polynesiense]|uniref:FeoA family protein n=1 Tax=Clostridium polynesiense TaxID=1325933 RepID=UPI00059113FA|nr:FeoA family protein [Clostridium polynesiense]